MNYNPLKRDSTWTMVLPGCYIDPGGLAHIFPHEFLAFLAAAHPDAAFDPDSKDDYEMVVYYYSRALKEIYPDLEIEFVRHDVEEN